MCKLQKASHAGQGLVEVTRHFRHPTSARELPSKVGLAHLSPNDKGLQLAGPRLLKDNASARQDRLRNRNIKCRKNAFQNITQST